MLVVDRPPSRSQRQFVAAEAVVEHGGRHWAADSASVSPRASASVVVAAINSETSAS